MYISYFKDSVKHFIEFFLNEVNKLEFDTEPPYAKIHTKLNECLSTLGHSGADNFRLFKSGSSTASKTPAKVTKKASASTASACVEEEPLPVAAPSNGSTRKKRQVIKPVEYDEEVLDEEVVIDESIEELKTKASAAKKTAEPKTPLAKPKRGAKKDEEVVQPKQQQQSVADINGISKIETYNNEDLSAIGNARSMRKFIFYWDGIKTCTSIKIKTVESN